MLHIFFCSPGLKKRVNQEVFLSPDYILSRSLKLQRQAPVRRPLIRLHKIHSTSILYTYEYKKIKYLQLHIKASRILPS